MTVKEKLIDLLIKKGLFESQAIEILDLSIPELEDVYDIELDSQAETYPVICYRIFIQSMNPTALAWIDENKPNAWFREMFI